MSAAPDLAIRVGRHQGAGKTRPSTLLALQASAAGALRAEVTPFPLTATGPACTPELAAWLVLQGLAVALVDEAGDGRQYLHVPAALGCGSDHVSRGEHT